VWCAAAVVGAVEEGTMRALLFVTFAACLPSLALCNPGPVPDVIHFDMGNGGPCIWPSPGDVITVTLYLDRLHWGFDGMYGIQFAIQRTFGGQQLSVSNPYQSVGGLMIGDPEVWPGFAMTCGPSCVHPNPQNVIPFAVIRYLYTGPPGTLTPIPYQAGDGAVYADCDNMIHEWYLDDWLPGGIAGIGMMPPAGCGASAVQDMTWGSIKALYR
jgi:hypothetical protein